MGASTLYDILKLVKIMTDSDHSSTRERSDGHGLREPNLASCMHTHSSERQATIHLWTSISMPQHLPQHVHNNLLSPCATVSFPAIRSWPEQSKIIVMSQ
jgi:hypothetical protein